MTFTDLESSDTLDLKWKISPKEYEELMAASCGPTKDDLKVIKIGINSTIVALENNICLNDVIPLLKNCIKLIGDL